MITLTKKGPLKKLSKIHLIFESKKIDCRMSASTLALTSRSEKGILKSCTSLKSQIFPKGSKICLTAFHSNGARISLNLQIKISQCPSLWNCEAFEKLSKECELLLDLSI